MTGDTTTTDEDAPDDEHDGGTADAPPSDAADDSRATGAAPSEAPDDAGEPPDADDEGDGVTEYLMKGALVMLVVLGVVATLQFYLSAQTAISRLASDQYRPAFVAGFNLVVLLAVGIGIAQVVRRLG